MTEIETLIESAVEIALKIREGKLDPLQIPLLKEYKDLQKLAASIDTRINIDEMLNEILNSKVLRVQELAKLIGAPETYVKRVERLKPRELAKFIRFRQPVMTCSLEISVLQDSFLRILRLFEKQAEDLVDEKPELREVPKDLVVGLSNGFDSEKLEMFKQTIPLEKPIALREVLRARSLDEFLDKFLLLVFLISEGQVWYDSEQRTVVRKTENRGGGTGFA